MHEKLVLKETVRSVEGLMLEKPALLCLHGGNLALINILVGVCIIYEARCFCMYFTSVCEH